MAHPKQVVVIPGPIDVESVEKALAKKLVEAKGGRNEMGQRTGLGSQGPARRGPGWTISPGFGSGPKQAAPRLPGDPILGRTRDRPPIGSRKPRTPKPRGKPKGGK